MTSYSAQYMQEVAQIAASVNPEAVDSLVESLASVRDGGGRLFILGVGGGAAHASHAVNDFRKLCNLEAYAPSDNVAELSARTNDDGWVTTYVGWLKTSRLSSIDAILVFSVGGGSREMNLSTNIVEAVEYASAIGAAVLGIVGRPDGAVARLGDNCIIVQAPSQRITPHVESFQAVLWHLCVSHPRLAVQSGAWESGPS